MRPAPSRRRALGIVVGVYLLGLGMLAGAAIDRLWFDRQRAEVLHRYEAAVRQWQAERMARERRAHHAAP